MTYEQRGLVFRVHTHGTVSVGSFKDPSDTENANDNIDVCMCVLCWQLRKGNIW